MKHVGSYDAKTHLPDILRQVESGETYVVTRHGKPIAQITPIKDLSELENPWDAMRRVIGTMGDDFFPDFEAYRKELDELPEREIEPFD